MIHLREEMARDFWRGLWREYQKPEFWGYWVVLVFGMTFIIGLCVFDSLGWIP